MGVGGRRDGSDSTHMQISSCENFAEHRIGRGPRSEGSFVSGKTIGSQGQYWSNDEKGVVDDPGNARGNRRREINELRHRLV